MVVSKKQDGFRLTVMTATRAARQHACSGGSNYQYAVPSRLEPFFKLCRDREQRGYLSGRKSRSALKMHRISGRWPSPPRPQRASLARLAPPRTPGRRDWMQNEFPAYVVNRRLNISKRVGILGEGLRRSWPPRRRAAGGLGQRSVECRQQQTRPWSTRLRPQLPGR